jgi:hypothetical protein
MKKILSGLILLLLVTLISGCGNDKLEKTLKKMSDAESYSMTLTMENIPIFGTMEMKAKVDGDKEYFYMTGLEFYLSKENETTYIYTKVGSTWEKTEYSEADLDLPIEVDEVDPKDFDAKWFKKEDDKYILQEEYYEEIFAEEAEMVKSLEIEIDDDDFIIYYEMSLEGFVIKVTLEITDINKTTIKLPK